ncbi:MAG: ORF6N domain-containing protein [Candidatus Coatesbacteria bacterium]
MKTSPVPVVSAEGLIHLIRGVKVILDRDLAGLYGVPTRILNQQVKRNRTRFPEDFLISLTLEEEAGLRSQIVISKKGRGGRRYPALAFTEQGVAMLSTVLNSERAICVNIEIMRAFVRMRGLAITYRELAEKVGKLEQRYDSQFRVVFDAIRLLMRPQDPSKPRIGFRPDREDAGGQPKGVRVHPPPPLVKGRFPIKGAWLSRAIRQGRA